MAPVIINGFEVGLCRA